MDEYRNTVSLFSRFVILGMYNDTSNFKLHFNPLPLVVFWFAQWSKTTNAPNVMKWPVIFKKEERALILCKWMVELPGQDLKKKKQQGCPADNTAFP